MAFCALQGRAWILRPAIWILGHLTGRYWQWHRPGGLFRRPVLLGGFPLRFSDRVCLSAGWPEWHVPDPRFRGLPHLLAFRPAEWPAGFCPRHRGKTHNALLLRVRMGFLSASSRENRMPLQTDAPRSLRVLQPYNRLLTAMIDPPQCGHVMRPPNSVVAFRPMPEQKQQKEWQR